MKEIPLDKAILLATITGSILFGIFTSLFATTTYILVFKKRATQAVNKRILAVSTLMYIIAFAHIVVAVQRTIEGFFAFRDHPGGPEAYFLRTRNALYLVKTTLYISQTIIGDAFVIYRAYIVWNGDKRILIPALVLLAGSIAIGAGSLAADDHASATTAVFATTSKHWIASFFSFTLFTNFTCTALIAGKIWWIERQARGTLRTRSLSPVAVIVVESGAIYSASLISLLVTYLAGTWGTYLVLDLVVQVIGIVFSLIIVRIGLGYSADDTTWRSRMTTTLTGRQVSYPKTNHTAPLAFKISRSRITHDDNGHTLQSELSFTDMEGGNEMKAVGAEEGNPS